MPKCRSASLFARCAVTSTGELTPSRTTKSLPAPCILVNLKRNSEPVHETGSDEIDVGLPRLVQITDVLIALPLPSNREIPVEIELHAETEGQVRTGGAGRWAGRVHVPVEQTPSCEKRELIAD